MREHLYALVDVDAMYVSCEQVLQPWLKGRPVVVLSHNDGCVIARSREAKALDIAMGQPWFQVTRHPRRSHVIPRSANFELYGDLSARLVSIVERYTPHLEPYSIDEIYLALPRDRAVTLARQLRAHVAEWLDLPVSIGIAPTRTLAHLATERAKHVPELDGVCDLAEVGQQRQQVLARTPTTEVWGIAARLGHTLADCGVTTAAELAAVDPGWARRAVSVVLERTVRELQGTACIPLEQAPPPRQQMLHSRHLGQPVTARETIADIAHSYAHTLARRLRRHERAAVTLQVHLSSDHYQPGPDLSVQASQTLPAPTAATRPLATTAAELARRLWRPGYHYRRVGVIAAELITWPPPPTLDCPEGQNTDEALQAAVETITARYGPHSIGLGRAGLRRSPWWATRQRYLWPVSTTRWEHLPRVYA